MNVYVVTDEDGESYRREYPGQPTADKWAIDAEDAAQMWADDAWPHYDHPDEMACLVTSPGGTPTRYIVTVEHVPSFYAIRAPS